MFDKGGPGNLALHCILIYLIYLFNLVFSISQLPCTPIGPHWPEMHADCLFLPLLASATPAGRLRGILCAKKTLILEVEIWKFFQKVTNQIPPFSKSFQKFCHLIGRRRRHRETVTFVLYSSFSLWSINLFAVLHLWIHQL